jgi:hypothetical protein
MQPMRSTRKIAFALMAVALLSFICPRCHAQGALLMEEPYGFFGALNPTGHTAVYFARICAETPVILRRCEPGEMGSVISRYQGISGYDWLAIPLIPYLYSVENAKDVPAHVDRKTVERLRDHYHETHLLSLGKDAPRGNFLHGGWTELVGAAYQRQIYAFRFATTERQDDAFIARMNAHKNRSHFQLIFNNCADFARVVLNFYFPRTFRRSFFPDAGMTTPKQIAYKLERYARKHPETELEVYEIPQIPGFRRHSRSNKSVAESLITNGYAIPIAILNPYLAGGIVVDYLIRGRFHIIPEHLEVLEAANLDLLTVPAGAPQNLYSASEQAPSATVNADVTLPLTASVYHPSLSEISVAYE